jgi:hypothetical protein
MQWLRDVHLQLPPRMLMPGIANARSCLLFGNEDAPDKLHLYTSESPLVDDPYTEIIFDDDFRTYQYINPKERA